LKDGVPLMLVACIIPEAMAQLLRRGLEGAAVEVNDLFKGFLLVLSRRVA